MSWLFQAAVPSQGLRVKRAFGPDAAGILWGDRGPVLRPCGGYSLLWGGSAVHGNGIQKIKTPGGWGSGVVHIRAHQPIDILSRRAAVRALRKICLK